MSCSPAVRPAARHPARRRRLGALAAVAAAVVLAGCGGSDDGIGSCSQFDQKDWLGAYMNEWYFWYRISPRPNPGGFADVGAYYAALQYTGTDPAFPADRWSRSESTESFNRFFGDGRSMGYGVSVNLLEARAQAGLPLYVRYVEPASDAAVKGVVRGDEVLSINGRTAAELILANDVSALTAANVGDQVTLQLRRGGVIRTVVVRADTYNLTPVNNARVVASPNGRLMGYLMVKDMVSQADAGLESAFALFRAQGVQELVVDLRYNGGGLVSVGARLASYIAGARGLSGATPRVFTKLLYNDKRAASNNQSFGFENRGNALGLPRVYLLTGPRTASASEQVINGLRGVDVQVVTIGDTTFGKPVGSLPQGYCGTTYSAVNFESANARDQGRFFDGFDASCPVAEDFTRAAGALDDPLLVSAAHHADTGACPLIAAAKPAMTRAEKAAARRGWVLDEPEGMLPR